MGRETSVLEVPKHILEYLDAQPTLTLATASGRGAARDDPDLRERRPEHLHLDAPRHDDRAADGGEPGGRVRDRPVRGRLARDQGASRPPARRGRPEPGRSSRTSSRSSSRSTRRSPAGSAAASPSSGSRRPSCSSSTTPTRVPPPAAGCRTSATSCSACSATCRTRRSRPSRPSCRRCRWAPATRSSARARRRTSSSSSSTARSRSCPSRPGADERLATLTAGQFFGEMAILRDTPRMATVRALEPTTLFAMDRDTFRGLVAQSMGTTRDFDQVIQQRLDEIRGSNAS